MDTASDQPWASPADSAGRRERHFAFNHDPLAPRHARSLVAQLITDPADPLLDDVRLVVSELVTNVIEHTDDGGVLRARDLRPLGPLRVEVEDHDLHAPPSRPERRAHGGRGLMLVDRVCTRWGVRRLEGHGKIIWAEFDVR